MITGIFAIKVYIFLVAIVAVFAAGWYMEQMSKEVA
jgi:hypothetical protein